MTTQKPLKLSKSVLKHPFIIILNVTILFYFGYKFGQYLFEILN